MRSNRGKVSAGLLMYRRREGQLEVFLAHPGGPFFRNKDEGAWSIPKGELEGSEGALQTALREFEEETGIRPQARLVQLGEVKQKSGKVVHAWAFEAETEEPPPLRSNTFRLEWPPGSGIVTSFPEIDRAQYFDLLTARRKINAAQVAFIERLVMLVGKSGRLAGD
jgi:predicted NUDIX family NTP pyrophosphohydrolase